MNKIAIAFVLLLLLTGIVNAQATNNYCNKNGLVNTTAPWYCSQINQAAAFYWSKWSPVAVAFVLFSFSIATIIFIAGTAFRVERLRAFGIGEIYEALATLLIIAFFLFISAVLFGLVPGITTGPIDPYNTSLTYINQTITSTEGVVTNLYNISVLDYYRSTIGLTVCYENYCTPGLDTFISYPLVITYIVPARTLTELLIDGLLALHTEYYLILFLMYAAIPVFLIPGIFFRAFIPTRSVGGMMIAMAIGFYMVMPLLFSVAFYFTHVSALSALNAASAQLYANGQGVNSQQNVIAPSPGHSLVQSVDLVQSSLGVFWLSILFYPGLIMALTYATIRTIAEFIGGMAQTSSRISML